MRPVGPVIGPMIGPLEPPENPEADSTAGKGGEEEEEGHVRLQLLPDYLITGGYLTTAATTPNFELEGELSKYSYY